LSSESNEILIRSLLFFLLLKTNYFFSLPIVELRSTRGTISFLFKVKGIADPIGAAVRALTDYAFSAGGLASGVEVVVVVKKRRVVTTAKLVRDGPVVEEEVKIEISIVLEFSLLVVNARDIALVIAIVV
jgi:hypothetical protein